MLKHAAAIFFLFFVCPYTLLSTENIDPWAEDSYTHSLHSQHDNREQLFFSFDDIALAPENVAKASPEDQQSAFISFSDVNITQFLNYISRISGKNFIFSEADLDFNISIIMEEPSSLDYVMTALLQILRVHGLALIENGDSLVIHRNPNVKGISEVITEDGFRRKGSEIVTRVFRLNALDPEKVASLLQPLSSGVAQIEFIEETGHVIVTDLTTNVDRIADLLITIDSPNSGLVIGQYVIRNSLIDNVIELAQEIMGPISLNQQLTFVPHVASNSVFVVSTPFLVERAISIMQHLDQTEGQTRIYKLEDLVPHEIKEEAKKPKWELDREGNWLFRSTNREGKWLIDDDGNWQFIPKGTVPEINLRPPKENELYAPKGKWLEKDQEWQFVLDPEDSIKAKPLERKIKIEPELPLGDIERTKFFIHKLQYRKGDEIETALLNIADSLAAGDEVVDEELVATIESVQWLETANALVFTGIPKALNKVNELIKHIDVPLREVFIEMLILETTLDDSLGYSVNLGSRFGGGDSEGAQAFFSRASTLNQILGTVDVNDTGITKPTVPASALSPGYNLGLIGRDISDGGTTFRSLAGLIRASRVKASTDIIVNPKIIAEDGVTAEIFVGVTTPFQTQSISNDEGSVVTTNVEYRDIGTTFRVTPFLGNGDIISLEIEQITSSTGAAQLATNDPLNSQSPGPTTRESRTETRVHVPDGYFVVLSGMMRDTVTNSRQHVPCLGGIPFIGAAFSDKLKEQQKRNQMIFIRPKIIDTIEELQNITKHQQDIYRFKRRTPRNWKYEMDEALDYLNLTGKEPCECNDSAESEYY